MEIRRILLVEDNPDDEMLARMALRKITLAVELAVARDGVEALEYLFCTGAYADRNPDLMPGLVLLDLKLPRMNGLEVLRRIRADRRTCYLPVVILTLSREEQDLAASYRLGVSSYVRKPVDFTRFSEALQLIATYWLTLNEFPPQKGDVA
jgi:two-component system response regulator